MYTHILKIEGFFCLRACFSKVELCLSTSSPFHLALSLEAGGEQSRCNQASEYYFQPRWDSIFFSASGPYTHLCFFGVGWNQKTERCIFPFFRFSPLYHALLLSTFLLKHKGSIST